jgi:DNA-binding transcriptional regulator of glucitol operon
MASFTGRITIHRMDTTTVFPMIPAASKSLWFFAIISLILVGALLLMVWLAWSMQHVRFTVSKDGLRLQGDLFGRLVPLKALKLDEAVVTNLSTDKEHQPKWRTMGTALPGYAAGWFKLRNGEKTLLFVTDKTRVARIPTTEGYSVMLSVSEPAELIDALKQQSAP